MDSIECFPWVKSVQQALLKTFPAEYNIDALKLLHKNLENELQKVRRSKDQHSLKNLFSCLRQFYSHFCWKINWLEDSSQMKTSCVKILSCIIQTGIVLNRGELTSNWIDNVLSAMRIFPGTFDLQCDALLLVNNMKKDYHHSYALILKHFLLTNKHDIQEPSTYFKTLFLLRRLKFMTKDKFEKAKIFSLAKGIPLPSGSLAWLTANELSHPSQLNGKNVAKQFLSKKLPITFFEQLRKVLHCDLYSESGTSLQKDYADITKSFIIDSGDISENDIEEGSLSFSSAMEDSRDLLKFKKTKRKSKSGKCSAAAENNASSGAFKGEYFISNKKRKKLSHSESVTNCKNLVPELKSASRTSSPANENALRACSSISSPVEEAESSYAINSSVLYHFEIDVDGVTRDENTISEFYMTNKRLESIQITSELKDEEGSSVTSSFVRKSKNNSGIEHKINLDIAADVDDLNVQKENLSHTRKHMKSGEDEPCEKHENEERDASLEIFSDANDQICEEISCIENGSTIISTENCDGEDEPCEKYRKEEHEANFEIFSNSNNQMCEKAPCSEKDSTIVSSEKCDDEDEPCEKSEKEEHEANFEISSVSNNQTWEEISCIVNDSTIISSENCDGEDEPSEKYRKEEHEASFEIFSNSNNQMCEEAPCSEKDSTMVSSKKCDDEDEYCKKCEKEEYEASFEISSVSNNQMCAEISGTENDLTVTSNEGCECINQLKEEMYVQVGIQPIVSFTDPLNTEIENALSPLNDKNMFNNSVQNITLEEIKQESNKKLNDEKLLSIQTSSNVCEPPLDAFQSQSKLVQKAEIVCDEVIQSSSVSQVISSAKTIDDGAGHLYNTEAKNEHVSDESDNYPLSSPQIFNAVNSGKCIDSIIPTVPSGTGTATLNSRSFSTNESSTAQAIDESIQDSKCKNYENLNAEYGVNETLSMSLSNKCLHHDESPMFQLDSSPCESVAHVQNYKEENSDQQRGANYLDNSEVCKNGNRVVMDSYIEKVLHKLVDKVANRMDNTVEKSSFETLREKILKEDLTPKPLSRVYNTRSANSNSNIQYEKTPFSLEKVKSCLTFLDVSTKPAKDGEHENIDSLMLDDVINKKLHCYRESLQEFKDNMSDSVASGFVEHDVESISDEHSLCNDSDSDSVGSSDENPLNVPSQNEEGNISSEDQCCKPFGLSENQKAIVTFALDDAKKFVESQPNLIVNVGKRCDDEDLHSKFAVEIIETSSNDKVTESTKISHTDVEPFCENKSDTIAGENKENERNFSKIKEQKISPQGLFLDINTDNSNSAVVQTETEQQSTVVCGSLSSQDPSMFYQTDSSQKALTMNETTANESKCSVANTPSYGHIARTPIQLRELSVQLEPLPFPTLTPSISQNPLKPRRTSLRTRASAELDQTECLSISRVPKKRASSRKLKCHDSNLKLSSDLSQLTLDSPSCKKPRIVLRTLATLKEDKSIATDPALESGGLETDESGSSFIANNTNNSQSESSKGYNLRSRRALILPGKLKM